MFPDSGAEDTRQRIIDAALALFSEVGYARATTRAIAERAGVNEVTIFRHFGSKKSLLMACVGTSNQQGFAQTFADHLTGDYAEDIRRMARLQRADIAQRVGVLRLFLCDAQAVSDLQEAMLLGAGDNRARLAGYFQRQIEAGIVRADVDPVILANAFDSLFSFSVLFQHFMGAAPAVPTDDALEALARVFIQGTMAQGER
ncbi:MAG: TetR/AcrR family transcriptional regulator [Anaerolineae bacterium]|nr:TetR/AcrR family transcriptional regulator [Anaerolineae bacterium]